MRTIFSSRATVERSSVEGPGMDSADVEEGVVFALAEVLGAEELGEADDVGAGAGGFADECGGFEEVVAGVDGAGHLDEGDFFMGHRFLGGDRLEQATIG